MSVRDGKVVGLYLEEAHGEVIERGGRVFWGRGWRSWDRRRHTGLAVCLDVNDILAQLRPALQGDWVIVVSMAVIPASSAWMMILLPRLMTLSVAVRRRL